MEDDETFAAMRPFEAKFFYNPDPLKK